jgi:lipopolysaccharide export system permease protein
VKILSRYLLREHVGPFTFALGALTGLLLLNQVARRFGDLIGKGLPWGVIASVFGLSIPFILARTVPMACLVAVLQAFTRLGQDAEVTALKASGINLGRMMRPVLLGFCVVALAEFAFVDQVLPRSNHQLKNLLIDIERKKPSFVLREQAVNEVVPQQLFLRAGRIDPASDKMRDVVIYDLGNATRRRTIYADSGFMRLNDERTDLYLTLFDGYIHDYDRTQAESFRRIFYHTDLVRVGNVGNRLERSGDNDIRSDREMSLCEMEAAVRGELRQGASLVIQRQRAIEKDALALVGVNQPRGDTARPVPRTSLTAVYCSLLKHVSKSLVPPEAHAEPVMGRTRQFPPLAPSATRRDSILRGPMHIAPDPAGIQLRATLASIEAQRRASAQRAASYMVEIHKKYSLAVSCVVFVLIGAPIALRFPRGGIGLVIGASVAIFGFYYIGLIGGESLADRGVITPFWSMWAPNLLMTAIGSILFLRLGYERASARGGMFGDWLQTRRRRRAARRLGR